ncbi:MAG: ATP-binding protein, partial [Gammaproteobacteria bacterium]|nr:ATP-binding protein [Gammaproteobacteria bacterium]
MSFERAQVSTLLDRLNEASQRLIFVTGPRQTGKTTVVDQSLERLPRPSLYLPVDEPESMALPRLRKVVGDETPSLVEATYSGERDSRWVVQAWERARIHAARSKQGFVLVFDEIQKIPNWSETVKGLWDADRREQRALHVVLLGSSPLLMQKGITESLAGRFEAIRLAHWSFQEMAAAFGFDFPQYIYFGGYPGAAPLIHEEPRWRDYVASALVEPNIERDIVAMDRIDKPALLKRLFELSAEFSGEILAYSKMVGQLDDAGNTTTLARYLQLLEGAGLVAGLLKYEGLARRQRSSSPKLNVLNTALMAVHSGYTFSEAQADRTFWGRLVESAVGAHLYNTGMPEVRLYYWRRGNHEVDFVLERGRRLVSIEVKSNGRGINLGGRKEFAKSFNPERSLLVGRDGISIEEFMSVPASHWFERAGAGSATITNFRKERARDHLQVREQHAATTGEPVPEYDARERQPREAWHKRVTSQAPSLRENRAPPALLHHLATAYFGDYIDAEGDTPRSRL